MKSNMQEPSPELLRQEAEKTGYRFANPESLEHFVEAAFTDGKLWKGMGERENVVAYPTLREKAIIGLTKEFENEGIDKEIIAGWCNTALFESKKLYEQSRKWAAESPTEGFSNPLYHGINTGEGHIEMVMAQTLITFLTLKRIAGHPEKLSDEQREFIDSRYGGIDTLRSLSARDLKRTIAYTAFHESGEWWPRMIPVGHLGEYRNRLQHSIDLMFTTDPENAIRLTDWSVKKRELLSENGVVVGYGEPETVSPDNPELKHVQTGENLARNGGGFMTGNDGREYWVEYGFGIILNRTGKPGDTAFNQPLDRKPGGFDEVERSWDKKNIVLGWIVRAGDLLQAMDKGYLTPVYVEEGNQETTLGAAILWKEFSSYMHHALASYKWLGGIGHANTSKFFVETVFEKWNVPPTLIGLLDQFGLPEKNGLYTNQYQKLRRIAGLSPR